jgi:hydroxymethylbilane synthase
MTPILRLGTRGSPLALAQAHETRDRLRAAHGWDGDAVEIMVIRTMGDAILDRALAEAGGKGLFTRELDAALSQGAIDIAVHSAKDVPTILPDDQSIAGYLPREDVRDAFISLVAGGVEALPRGARVGSASLRRQALLRRARPDLEVTLLRGNVGTRLEKLGRGEMHATLLAMAGLNRLGLADRATAALDIDTFLPAVGQGAIAIATRNADSRVTGLIAPILDPDTGIALRAERAFLAILDGSCRTPIAGHARRVGGGWRLDGLVLRPDGTESFAAARIFAPEEAAAAGRDCGREILSALPPGILGGPAPGGH